MHSVKGELAATDPLDKVRTKSHCKVHAFKMAPGSIYTIDLVSTDFDSFLRLENAEGRQLAFDDDGGGGFNSRIVFRPLKEEVFRIIATTYPIGQTGKYTLTIRQAVQPVPGKVVFSHKDRLLADDPPDKVRRNPHKVHTFKMKAGQVYFLDLVSTEFDTYLRLEDSSGKQLAEDDDSGGNLNARIVFHAQREDNYRIIATSYQAGASGMYTLTVREALAPAAAK